MNSKNSEKPQPQRVPAPAGPDSRQVARAALRDRQYRATRVPGTARRNRKCQPEPRKARRQMARALAAAAWKQRGGRQ
jgi:hypothetical protein